MQSIIVDTNAQTNAENNAELTKTKAKLTKLRILVVNAMRLQLNSFNRVQNPFYSMFIGFINVFVQCSYFCLSKNFLYLPTW